MARTTVEQVHPFEGGTKECSTCAHTIPLAARKCTVCDSFQDWRAQLSFNTTILSLLIALVSTMSAALPVFQSYAAGNDSDIYVQFLSSRPSGINLAAVNRGTKPGFVAEGTLSDNGRDVALLWEANGNAATLIPPGQVVGIRFRVIEFVGRQVDRERHVPTHDPCHGRVSITNFRSNNEEATFGLPCPSTKPSDPKVGQSPAEKEFPRRSPSGSSANPTPNPPAPKRSGG